MASSAPDLAIRPVTSERMDQLAALFRTGEPGGCWDMEPRLTPAEDRACIRRWQIEGIPRKVGRRGLFCALPERPHAPGLLACRGEQPVGWVSVGPRSDYQRIAQSRALPPLDDVPVWVIPCLYVHPAHRGQGVAVALLRAAVAYAAEHGAPAVEGYPRDPSAPVAPVAAFYGTVTLFRRVGFTLVRPPLAGLPGTWTPRYTMRTSCQAPDSRPRP
jgi:GNAT superfamily N-acetyltransferase